MGNPLQRQLYMALHGLCLFKNVMGTSASIIFHSKSKDPIFIISVSSVPNNDDKQSMYQSKLAGMSGLALYHSSGVHYPQCPRRFHHYFSRWQTNYDCSIGRYWALNPEQQDCNLIIDIKANVQ
jgi:hypothetical protein